MPTASSLQVRQARPSDAAWIADCNCRLARESEGKELDANIVAAGVAAGLADGSKASYYIAEVEGTPAGMLMITFEWSDWRNGWLWWIQSVYVHQEFRRRGVFRQLYAHVHQLASDDPNVIGLRLYLEQNNRRAEMTYLAVGMKSAGYVVFERFPL